MNWLKRTLPEVKLALAFPGSTQAAPLPGLHLYLPAYQILRQYVNITIYVHICLYKNVRCSFLKPLKCVFTFIMHILNIQIIYQQFAGYVYVFVLNALTIPPPAHISVSVNYRILKTFVKYLFLIVLRS